MVRRPCATAQLITGVGDDVNDGVGAEYDVSTHAPRWGAASATVLSSASAASLAVATAVADAVKILNRDKVLAGG